MDRIDKIISSQIKLSRKETVKIIKNGQVKINNRVITNPAEKTDPTENKIFISGKELIIKKFVYIMMNKPKGVISASADKNVKTAVDLLGESFSGRNLFPAGRLDKDSTGFLLITDDGQFAHNILAPKKHVKKTYIVTTDSYNNNLKQAFADGIILSNGEKCLSAEYKQISAEPPTAEIILKEGKYHQIKRMLGQFDIKVIELKRIKIGGLALDENLKPGEWKELDNDDVLKITSC